jgi:hypothetical protein
MSGLWNSMHAYPSAFVLLPERDYLWGYNSSIGVDFFSILLWKFDVFVIW